MTQNWCRSPSCSPLEVITSSGMHTRTTLGSSRVTARRTGYQDLLAAWCGQAREACWQPWTDTPGGSVAASQAVAFSVSQCTYRCCGKRGEVERLGGLFTKNAESRRLLFIGSPGPGHLFDQVAVAISQVPGASLAVAGREPSPAVWARAQAVLGHRLTHLGWLDPNRLAEEISASALGLATYAPLAAYMTLDGSPTKVYEFAAAGLPVVGSPIPPSLNC